MNEIVLTLIILVNTLGICSNFIQFNKWKKTSPMGKDYQFLDFISDYKGFTNTEVFCVVFNALGFFYGLIAFFYYIIL
jgi:hypothetical protein